MNKLVWFVVLVCLSGTAAAATGTHAQKKAFNKSFERADTNHDGKLSMAEAEKKAPGVALRFALMDANRDGMVSQKELLGYVEAQRKQAAARFKRADKNGDGALSRKEARALPGVYARFAQMDANHNGKVTPREIGQYARAQIARRKAAAAGRK